MLKPNPHLANLPVYEPGRPIEDVARDLGIDPKKIIKLASNENALGPSPKAIKAMRDTAKRVHIYPDGNAFALRQAIANKHGLNINQIVLGNGSNEIIEFLGHAYLSPGDELIISQYAFAVYEMMGKMFQANVIEVPAKSYGHDLDAIRAAITPRTRLIFVANPNNPTGTFVSSAALQKFIESIPDHVILALDEAYYEFLKGALDTPKLIARKPNLVIMRTFSKAQGLAGLRIGYGMASAEVAAALQKVRQPFQANLMAQNAALAALGDEAHTRKTIKNTLVGLAFLEKELKKRKLEFLPSAANFILVKTGNGKRVFEGLLRHGIIVRAMDGYKLPDWIRVTVGLPSENKKFLSALDQCLKG